MKLVLTLGLLTLLTLAGAAQAQSVPEAKIIVTVEVDHDSMTLPDSDQSAMPVRVSAKAINFVCAQEHVISVELHLGEKPFPAHYGASLNPSPASVEFVIPSGKPGTTETPLDLKEEKQINMEVAWADTRPKEGASFTYIIASRTTVPATPACPNLPSKAVEGRDNMTAVGIDKTEDALPAGCAPDDPRPECAPETTAAPPPESPGFDTILLLAAAAGLVYARRRRA